MAVEKQKRIKSEADLDAEAAAWFTRLHSGDVSAIERAEFEAWLHSDRAHKVAYREFEQVYRDLDFVALEAGVDIDESLGRPRLGWQGFYGWFHRPAIVGVTAVCGIGLAFLMAALLVPKEAGVPNDLQTAAQDISGIQTGIAEIRSFSLEDGSIVTLGPRSQIVATFSADRRQVKLVDGEAFFEVSHDSTRPFFVEAQDTLVRVVGTSFDVKLSADIVHVSVLEGVVEVLKPTDIDTVLASAKTDGEDRHVLSAGERISSARRVALPQARQVERAKAGAWREGRLAYEDASLAEIVSDLNRYSDQAIEIASPDVGDFRSTIAFRAEELDGVFDVMSRIHPIKVERLPSGEIVLSRSN